MPRTGPITGSFLEHIIKKTREKKDPKDYRKNIIPNMAEFIPVPSDVSDMVKIAAGIATNPSVRQAVGSAIGEGVSKVKKDPLGTAKQLAIENPIDTAALVATGGLAGLRSASYKLPLHVRSYLRAMAHVPTTQRHLPKHLEPKLKESLALRLGYLEEFRQNRIDYQGVGAYPFPDQFESVKDFLKKAEEFPEEDFLSRIPSRSLVKPPVEKLIKRGILKESDQILPLSDLLHFAEKADEEIYNTLGKFYLRYNSKKPNQLDIVDYYKFYPIQSKEKTNSLIQSIVDDAKSIISKNKDLTIKDRIGGIRHLINLGLQNPDFAEAFGIRYGGGFPQSWKLKLDPEDELLRARLQALSKEGIPRTEDELIGAGLR
jgi:hypothetical protein